VPEHRVGPLADIARDFERNSPTQLEEGPAQALGAATALALVGLLCAALLGLAGRPVDTRLRAAAGAAVMAIVTGAVGGFALLIVYLGTDWLRSWSRLSILIAWFATVALGVGLDRLGRTAGARGIRPAIAGIALAGLLAIALLDQTTGKMAPPHERLAAAWHADARFVDAIEARMPRGASVYELPYMPFPEQDYRLAAPFVHSDTLRWSFGAMAGRRQDWGAGLVGLPGAETLPGVAAAGFSGVYLDRALYPDGGAGPAAELRSLTGQHPLVSAEGTKQFFDLRPYAAAVRSRLGVADFGRLRTLTLAAVQALPGPTLSALQLDGRPPSFGGTRWSHEAGAYFELDNPLHRARRVAIKFVVRPRSTAPAAVSVTAPGVTRRLTAPPAGAPVEVQTTLPAGRSRLRIQTGVRPGAENLVFGVTALTLHDLEAVALAKRARP
jgi:hypothetical protein